MMKIPPQEVIKKRLKGVPQDSPDMAVNHIIMKLRQFSIPKAQEFIIEYKEERNVCETEMNDHNNPLDKQQIFKTWFHVYDFLMQHAQRKRKEYMEKTSYKGT